jgi:hypothetical protein
MKISITYSVADNDTYDFRGRKQARVVETYSGVEGAEERVFIVPGVVADAFVRARRATALRILTKRGYAKSEPIDWSFLEKGTKQ